MLRGLFTVDKVLSLVMANLGSEEEYSTSDEDVQPSSETESDGASARNGGAP